MELPKKHLSHSQINMFIRCPKQYYYRYIEELVSPPSGMLILGKSGHEAIGYNYGQKIESHKDLKTSEVVDYFAEDFDSRVENEEPVFTDKTPGQLKDSGVSVLKEYQKTKSKLIQPKAVEQEFNIEFENVDYGLKGFIDLVTNDEKVIDHKFSKRTPSQAALDESLQLTAYRAGYEWLFESEPKELGFDYLITKKKPEIRYFETFRTKEDVDEYMELLGQISELIKTGIFYKNTQGWQCSEKFCGYFSKCRPHKTIF